MPPQTACLSSRFPHAPLLPCAVLRPPVRQLAFGLGLALVFATFLLRPAQGGALPAFATIAGGYDKTCGITAEGEVFCWGADTPYPARLEGLRGPVQEIALGDAYACVLYTGGSVQCWGENDGGQLGDGTREDRAAPVDVVGLGSDVRAIRTGFRHTCVITAAGGVKCWGKNDTGQLGNGAKVDSTIPVDVVDLESGVTAIAAGGRLKQLSVKPLVIITSGHTCALAAGGRVYCWGDNDQGQLGYDMPESAVPFPVADLDTDIQSITAGAVHTCALTTGGAAMCWGANWSGQLGNGAAPSQDRPQVMIGLARDVTQIAAGEDHTCALRSDGEVRCAGMHPGNGGSQAPYAPAGVVRSGSAVQSLAAGGGHTCALTADGAVQCWGSAGSDALGNFTMTSMTMQPVTPAYLAGELSAAAVGGESTCAIVVTAALDSPPEPARSTPGAVRTIVCWGANHVGQLGDGQTLSRLTPQPVTGLGDVQALASGNDHACALDAFGGLHCWGLNNHGQLGGDLADYWRARPVPVRGLDHGVVGVTAGAEHSCALLDNARLRCWGSNSSGQLGDATTVDRFTPVAVALERDVLSAAAGGTYTCALLTNGEVSCWGAERSTTPVKVNLPADVVAVEVGGMHACALRSEGQVQCWGWNYSGQLGNGTQIDAWEPVDVVGLPPDITAIAAGISRSCAVNGSGALYCWGSNFSGVLGDGTQTDRLTPVRVTGLGGPVAAVGFGFYHTCALVRTAGGLRLQCWGGNGSGQLGINNGWLPVDVIAPTTWQVLPLIRAD